MGFYRYIDYAIKCLIRKIIYSKWFWRIAFLVICIIVCANSVFAASNVPVYECNGLRVTSTANPTTLTTGNAFYGVCFPISKGVTYNCDFGDSETDALRSVFTEQYPAVGVTAYDFNSNYNGMTNYSFISKYDGYCLFFNTYDVTVTVVDDSGDDNIVPVEFTSAGSVAPGTGGNLVSSSTHMTYYAFLENNVEYTLTLINSGTSIVSVGTYNSPTIPYVGGHYDIVNINPISPGVTSRRFIGQNNWICVYPPNGSDVSFTLSYKEPVSDETTLGDVQESINNNDSAIISGQENINNSINEQGDKIENALTSTDYDESTINIDTSALDNLETNLDIINYPMQIVQKLSELISAEDWGTVEVIDIVIPFTGFSIQLKSDMLYNFIKDSTFYDLLQVFWIYFFGRYLIHFGLRIYHWLRTGEAVRKTFNLDSEAITSALM